MKWTDLSGKTIKIWQNGYNGKVYYTASVSNKKADGSYDNMYIDVQIPKNAAISNGEEVKIKKGFISFYKNKDGMAKLKIVIMEIEGQEQVELFGDSELPF